MIRAPTAATCCVCGKGTEIGFCLISLGWFSNADGSGYRRAHHACAESAGLLKPARLAG